MLFPARRRASALIITLALVVLMTILAVGIFTATRMEITASKLHLDATRAELFAQAGESVALARLVAGTSGTNRAWISQPGRLVTSPTNAGTPLTNIVELHSGFAAANATADTAADLNPTTFQSTSNNLIMPPSAFTGASQEMRIQWIYALANGSFTNVVPVYNATNPVVGRFAFWVDDDSTKVNLNTAFLRSAATTNVPSSDPLRIDLSPLLGGAANASAVASYRTNTHYFNSPEDVRQVGPDVAAAAKTNSHVLTHYNHAPNLNMFGERRIILTTRRDLAELTYPDLAGNPAITNYFLDIFTGTNQNIDPGALKNVDVDKVNRIIRQLVTTLNRTDWPILPGTNYTSKFVAPSSPTNINAWTVQTLADILDYVRSKESTNEVVSPVRYSGVDASTLSGPKRLAQNGGNSSLGTTRAPLITEMGAWVSPVRVSARYPAQFFVELYMPAGQVNLTDYKLRIGIKVPSYTNNYRQIYLPISASAASVPGTDTNAAYPIGGGGNLSAGTYKTLTAYLPDLAGANGSAGGFTTNRPTELTMFAHLDDGITPNEELIARGPNENPVTKAYFTYNVDGTNVPITSITSMSTVDPFVGKSGKDFVQGPQTFNSANPQNAVYANPSAFFPQLDSDASGQVVTNRAKVPTKKGSPENPFGIIESLAELGAVHVGLNGDDGPGVPWRTLRLQPVLQSRTELPDWALIDLFCVPVRTNATASQYKFMRPGGNMGGVINVNSGVVPFVDAGGLPTVTKTNALAALLTGARSNGTNAISASVVTTLMQNLQARSLANSGGNRGRSFGSGLATNLLFSPGQMVEFTGVADQGESSEQILGDILDLTTTRSGVFTVHSIGQAVYQSPQGNIRVLAETRRQNTVELSGLGTATSTNGIVFTKKLNP